VRAVEVERAVETDVEILTPDPPKRRRRSSDDMLATMQGLLSGSGPVQPFGPLSGWAAAWPGFDTPIYAYADGPSLRRGSSAPPKPASPSRRGSVLTPIRSDIGNMPFGYVDVGYPTSVKREWSLGFSTPTRLFTPTKALDGFDFGLDIRKYSLSQPSTPFTCYPGPVIPQFDFGQPG
jgi:hypothetical protein